MDFDQINITLFNLSEVFMALNNNSSIFNGLVEKSKNAKVEDVYLTFNNLMVDWGINNITKKKNYSIMNFFRNRK